jgi:muramoyltetrapeptide carboxypeptidase
MGADAAEARQRQRVHGLRVSSGAQRPPIHRPRRRRPGGHDRAGRIRAPLTGGTTSILCATLGTPWELDTEGRLLLLEEVGEEPYRIDRLLTQLGHAGKLAAAAGFIVSEHTGCAPARPERSQTLMQVLRRHLHPLGKPCLYGLPLGHGEHLASVPLGVPVVLDAGEQTLRC